MTRSKQRTKKRTSRFKAGWWLLVGKLVLTLGIMLLRLIRLLSKILDLLDTNAS